MNKGIHFIITGGTIDSVFNPARDMVVVNDSTTIAKYIEEVIHPHFKISQEIVTMKDSREITDNIREEILRSIEKCHEDFVLITHGTYTMAKTAEYLAERIRNSSKRIVLTGSMLPLQGFAPSDAPFNLGFAIASVFLASPGVYLAMNGRLFGAGEVLKNVGEGRFEEVRG